MDYCFIYYLFNIWKKFIFIIYINLLYETNVITLEYVGENFSYTCKCIDRH